MCCHIVIFCKPNAISRIRNKIILGLCDFVNVRTTFNGTLLEVLDTADWIDLRLDIIEKTGGLRPSHVLFDESCDREFIDGWVYNMGGRYTELNSLDDVIKLVIEKEG